LHFKKNESFRIRTIRALFVKILYVIHPLVANSLAMALSGIKNPKIP
jgi:hypothetical protein